jgi:hypothetical protein
MHLGTARILSATGFYALTASELLNAQLVKVTPPMHFVYNVSRRDRIIARATVAPMDLTIGCGLI